MNHLATKIAHLTSQLQLTYSLNLPDLTGLTHISMLLGCTGIITGRLLL